MKKYLIFKKMLPKIIFDYLRRLGNAFVTPFLFSYETGHFFSSLINKPVDKKFLPLPWYSLPSIHFLNNFDFRNKIILEFGSGQSTFWWCSKAKKVISYENDQEWFDLLVKKTSNNTELRFVDGKYLNELNIEKLSQEKYDVIIIDGNIDRFQTLEVSEKSLNNNGLIVVDNSETYFEGNSKYDKFPMLSLLKEKKYLRIDFFGYVPGLIVPHCTSIFFKPNCFLFDQNIYPPISNRSDFYFDSKNLK